MDWGGGVQKDVCMGALTYLAEHGCSLADSSKAREPAARSWEGGRTASEPGTWQREVNWERTEELQPRRAQHRGKCFRISLWRRLQPTLLQHKSPPPPVWAVQGKEAAESMYRKERSEKKKKNRLSQWGSEDGFVQSTHSCINKSSFADVSKSQVFPENYLHQH